MNIAGLFRKLSDEEVAEFKKAARDNYEPFSEINMIHHPVYVLECATINHEKYLEEHG